MENARKRTSMSVPEMGRFLHTFSYSHTIFFLAHVLLISHTFSQNLS